MTVGSLCAVSLLDTYSWIGGVSQDAMFPLLFYTVKMSEDKCGCLHPIPLTTLVSNVPDTIVPVGCGSNGLTAVCNYVGVGVNVWRYEVDEGKRLAGTFITGNCSELKICFDIAAGDICGKITLILEATIKGSDWCAEVEDEAPFFVEDRILCWNIVIPDDVDTTGYYSVYFNLRPKQSGVTIFVYSAGYCCVR